MKQCSKCGKDLNDNARFCGNCGAKIDNDISPQYRVQPTESTNNYAISIFGCIFTVLVVLGGLLLESRNNNKSTSQQNVYTETDNSAQTIEQDYNDEYEYDDNNSTNNYVEERSEYTADEEAALMRRLNEMDRCYNQLEYEVGKLNNMPRELWASQYQVINQYFLVWENAVNRYIGYEQSLGNTKDVELWEYILEEKREKLMSIRDACLGEIPF